MDWLSRGRKQGRESRRQEDLSQIKLWRETSQSLALSIEQICTLCEDLALAAASGDAAAPESTMENVQAQIEAVRRYAACIANDAAGSAEPTPVIPDPDPYSLKELHRLMTSEPCE
ncbi:hypothetical protein [Capsulimonas corticalis]|nr:hypothetical protein [Capsulimonas corticalis]